jgi:hypothetical protein
MSIATPPLTSFTAGELSPRLEGRVDLAKYFNGCRTLLNFHVHPHGGISRRCGFRFVGHAMDHDAPGLLIPFEFNPDQTYILEFGEQDGTPKMRVFADHGLVQGADDRPFELDVPYAASELERLRYVQSNDVLVLVHKDHPPRTLTRRGHAQWELAEMEFLGRPEAWGEGNYPACCCFFEQRLVLAATPEQPGTIWFSRTGHMHDFRLRTCEAPMEAWRDRVVSGTGTGAYAEKFTVRAGGLFDAGSGVRGRSTDGGDCYYRYRGGRIYAPDSANMEVTFVETPGSTARYIETVHGPDGLLREEFWELVMPGDRIVSEAGQEPLDDDAMEITLAGREGNNIEFLVPRARLWVGTSGGEWTVGSSDSGVLTPSCVKADHQGSCGSQGARPETVGCEALFIQRSGSKVRGMGYRDESDAYASRDLTLLSEHIAGPGLTQLAYAQEPDSVVYALRKDGALACLTMEPDEDVVAWSRLQTDGQITAIACVHHGPSRRDELWVLVRRERAGQSVCNVEYLEARTDMGAASAFFVDSGLTHAGEPARTLCGLDHLAGRVVTVLADGAVHPEVTVDTDGSITLEREASVIHAGLPFESVVQPMRLEAGSNRGTAQTKRKRIVRVAVRFHDTLGGGIGPAPDNLEPVYFRSPADRMDNPPELWAGDKRVLFPKGWNRDGVLTVVQRQPLPMTVLMIVPEVVVNE